MAECSDDPLLPDQVVEAVRRPGRRRRTGPVARGGSSSSSRSARPRRCGVARARGRASPRGPPARAATSSSRVDHLEGQHLGGRLLAGAVQVVVQAGQLEWAPQLRAARPGSRCPGVGSPGPCRRGAASLGASSDATVRGTAARSTSFWSRVPVGSSPELIAFSRCWATWKYSGTGLLRSMTNLGRPSMAGSGLSHGVSMSELTIKVGKEGPSLSDEEQHGRRRGEPESGHLELALPQASDQQDPQDRRRRAGPAPAGRPGRGWRA